MRAWWRIFAGVKVSDPAQVRKQQNLLFGGLIFALLVLVMVVWVLMEEKNSTQQRHQQELQAAMGKHTKQLELPDGEIEQDLRWRQYLEKEMQAKFNAMQENFTDLLQNQNAIETKKQEALLLQLAQTQEKLQMAQEELASASLDLKHVRQEERQQQLTQNTLQTTKINKQDMTEGAGYQMDVMKPAEYYIAEGTFFDGYLLGGIAVSTALSAADEHATPVVIRLTKRGNLSAKNQLHIEECRMLGSAYGDLPSERAIIRLEKMVCEIDGAWQTSDIVGQVFGPDGYNGVKGKVVSKADQHLKNAMFGGIISGFAGVAKGQDAAALLAGGVVATPKKGVKEMLGQGGLQGASNAGEKLADYYLRKAEAMSPVLLVPAGVKVNTQITKGFFIGERGMRQKISAEKK